MGPQCSSNNCSRDRLSLADALHTEDSGGALGPSACVAVVAERRDNRPKDSRPISDLMVFASQRLGSEHSEHTITALPHVLGGPPGEVLLKVAVLAALGHKSIGSKNNHAAGRKPFHVRQHPPAVVLLQMLY